MFPSLPTDNLYKFIFVGCIFLIGLIVYDRNKKIELLSETYNNLIIERTKHQSQRKILNIDIDRLEKDVDYLQEQENKAPKNTLDSLKTRLDNYSKGLETQKESAQILSTNIDNIIKKMDDFESNKKKWNNIILVLFGGSVLSGFAWYFKVQKLQDSILSDEAILKKIQVRNDSKSKNDI